MVVQKHVGSARVVMNATQERIKRFYLLFMRNDNRFLRVFSLVENVSIGISIEKRKERKIGLK